MHPTLVIATSNPGKLRDFAAAAEVFSVAIEPLPGLGGISAPEESKSTFEGNARLKAAYYSRSAPGRVVLADDSGLEVDALHGAPGVHSARYAQMAGVPNPSGFSPDHLNNQHLLTQLASVQSSKPHSARYRCVLAAARNGHILATAQGAVEGQILTRPRGHGGFGYDPLFLLPELGLTMAEIDLATRQRLSHRGRALLELLSHAPAVLSS
jgi:XTP/dITP diphosphohydrolase